MEFFRKYNDLQKSALTVATLTAFLGPFLISSVNIALPAIEEEFSLNAVTLGWVVTSYLLASAVFLLPIGRFADIRGQKTVFKWGIVIFTIATVSCGLAPNGHLLILFRVFQGFGAAMTMTTGMPILISAFPPQERGKMLGINVASVYLGLSMGPFFGGILTQHMGWRSIFLLCIPLGLVAVILTFVKLKKFRDTKHQEGIDFAGSLFYCLALVGLVYGSINLNKYFGLPLLGAGVIFFILFIIQTYRAEHPVFEIRLFTHNRLFAFSNIAALINYSATFAIVFLMSLHLQKVKGLSPQEAGLILVSQPLVMALLSPLAGRMSDRIEPRMLASLGMFLNASGLFLLSAVNETTSSGIIVSILLFMGLGFALFSSPNMNTIMSSVERKQYGIASGTSATMRVLGQMVSMSVATMIFAFYFGSGLIKNVPVPVFVKSEHISFLIFGIICLTGVYFSFSRGNLRE